MYRVGLRRVAFGLSLVLGIAWGSAPAIGFGQEESSAESPRFIVNLLDYLASDYGGAISANGEVLSGSEYREQMEFAGSALETARRLPETRDATDVVAKIEVLQKLVEQKARPAEVAARAQEAKTAVIAVAHIPVAPGRWPSLAEGHALFEKNCVACHGAEGRGDGPAGLALDPRPANFFDEKMEDVSPFQAFNVIRVGVPGTAMAPFPQLSDAQIWDLAFYVLSLRHQARGATGVSAAAADVGADRLVEVATRSDHELQGTLAGSGPERERRLALLRLHSEEHAEGDSLALARAALRDSGVEYRSGRIDSARTLALRAYLEGVEPVEPRLRANDAALTSTVEERMAAVRSAIEGRRPVDQVEASIQAAYQSLDRAAEALAESPSSPWITFLIAAGILLREGFEAVLIVVALLAVIRAARSRGAAAWVHGGWLAALGLGGLAWIFSGWLLAISGAQRELMEAVTSFVAVAVLLYMGFWLHSKTEIHRWKHFIEVQVKSALAGGNRIALAGIAFMAVFREAFETVLFLRAVALEGGDGSQTAMALGVAGALCVVLAGAWILLRYSARIPVPKVFAVSSLLMIVLSVILAGKGMHALQEIGQVGITSIMPALRWDTLGIYPTSQTLLAQAGVLSLSVALWFAGKRAPATSVATRMPEAQRAGEL